jgi:hypothetical protein
MTLVDQIVATLLRCDTGSLQTRTRGRRECAEASRIDVALWGKDERGAQEGTVEMDPLQVEGKT